MPRHRSIRYAETVDGTVQNFTFVATATTHYIGIIPVVTTLGQYGEITDAILMTLDPASAMTERFDAITYLADRATTAIGATGDARRPSPARGRPS